MGVRVGIDVGGTFTDLCAWDGRTLSRAKVPTTPDDVSRGVLDGLSRLGLAPGFDLVLGTTLATNTLLERKGARVASVTTAGFRDLLHLARQNRPELYDWHVRKPLPLVAPEDCHELPERVAADGGVLTRLDESAAAQLAECLGASGAEVVAVCLLFGHLNPAHEERFAELAAPRGVRLCLASALVPEFREYERATTTVVNAYVMPAMSRFLERLEPQVRAAGGRDLRILQSNGGQTAPRRAATQPVRTILSGPAGGAIAALHAARQIGLTRVLTYDMGGTSTDVAQFDDGLAFAADTQIDDLPIRIPQIAIHTVGRGGGSIAALDAGGALIVGPQSAGADPGPACYGRGDEPTVTDANLLLGRLRADHFLDQQMRLDVSRSAEAIGRLAARMGCAPLVAARAIVDVANAGMEHALQVVCARRGHDPARHWLVSFGGAGGLHAAALAETLELPGVIVPPDPGILSATGMLLADTVLDFARSLPIIRGGGIDLPNLRRVFGELMDQAADALFREGFDLDDAICERLVDLRYAGQAYELTVPAVSLTDATRLTAAFHAEHARVHGICDESGAVEVVTARVRAVVATPPYSEPPLEPAGEPLAPPVLARVNADFGGTAEAALIERGALRAGHVVSGPAVIVEPHATTLVPPDWRATVESAGHLRLVRLTS